MDSLYEEQPIFQRDIALRNKEDREKAEREFRAWRNKFRNTFGTPDGAEVLVLLMYETYVFRNYNQHNAGAYAKEGKREIGNLIMEIVGSEFVLEKLISIKKRREPDERRKLRR